MKKKEENTLSSGYSGKTQAILRDALKKADAGVVKLPVTFKDGEDKSLLTFYVEGPECMKTWVTHSKSEEPMVVRNFIAAKAPLTNALPDLSRVPRGDTRAVLSAIRVHQDAVTLDMVQREAGREALRRQLLEREIIAWRREQMEKTFNSERTEAHFYLKRTMAHFEKELEVFKKKFAATNAASSRMDAIHAQRALSDKQNADAGIQ